MRQNWILYGNIDFLNNCDEIWCGRVKSKISRYSTKNIAWRPKFWTRTYWAHGVEEFVIHSLSTCMPGEGCRFLTCNTRTVDCPNLLKSITTRKYPNFVELTINLRKLQILIRLPLPYYLKIMNFPYKTTT